MLETNRYLGNVKRYFIILLCVVVSSCHNSEIVPIPGDQHNIVFQLSDVAENKINVVDVLAFKVDNIDNSKETFAYRAKGRDIVEGGSAQSKRFTASLRRDEQTLYRFVVLTGCRTQLDALGDIVQGTDKATLLNSLLSTHVGVWITDEANPNYIDIPMWAQTETMSLTESVAQISGIKLLRMLARVDVTLDVAVQSKFKIKTIRVYNYITKGRIVPNTDPLTWDGEKALRPTLPPESVKEFGPLVFRPTVDDVESVRDIYLYEAIVSSAVQPEEATCLVLGGEYNNEGITTYYRVDMAKVEDGNVVDISLVRNHLYTIKITSVEKSGFTTPDEAFDAGPLNIKADIVVWDRGLFKNIKYDDRYFLATSHQMIDLPLNQRTVADQDNKLSITTNDPNGWYIEKITDAQNGYPSWITADRYVGSAELVTTISILTQDNQTGASRTAFIYIRAEVLVYVVAVTQSAVQQLSLKLTDGAGLPISQLLFGSAVSGVAQTKVLNVDWTPPLNSNTVSVTTLAGVTSFDFATGDRINSGVIADAIQGHKSYSIHPSAMTQAEIDADPFKEKSLKVNFTVGNGTAFESKTIFITQKNYAAVPTTSASYVMNGTEQSFRVNSNTSWELEITDDPYNIISYLEVAAGGHFEDKRNETVTFITNPYTASPPFTEALVTLRLRGVNSTKSFPDKIFTLKFLSQ